MTQLEKPSASEQIAVIKTNMGEMKVRFFADKAPKAVENFMTHAQNGYYNGLIFHRVIKDFMVQGGDPLGSGRGGESIWGTPFEDEFDIGLRNFYGALSMANSGKSTNGSQFFIVQAKSAPESMISQMERLEDGGFPKEVTDTYKKIGGTPWLDFKHTVFGQVFEGLDILESIAAVPTGAGDKPVSDVVVEAIDIINY